MKRLITKEIFLGASNCLTWSWWKRHVPAAEDVDAAASFVMEQGIEIGNLARKIYPDGILVANGRPSDMGSQTRKLLADRSIKILLEATFIVDDCIARADILVRNPKGWKLIEVKSALDNTSRLDNLIDDLAYTTMIAIRAGMRIQNTSLLLVSRNYRASDDINRLFTELNKTQGVKKRLPPFRRALMRIRRETASLRPPRPRLASACINCDLFSSTCLGKGIDQPATELPRIGKKISRMSAFPSILDIPNDFPLSPAQRRVVGCVQQGSEYLSPVLRSDLEKIRWPAYYLDFETVTTALPLYDGVVPYEQIVTQYSLHRCIRPGKIEKHFEFLSDPRRDCRFELAKKLLINLGDIGSIIVYSGFEKGIIKSLAAKFPALAVALYKVIDRLFDILEVIQRDFYHPAFHGSYSIKTVLPILVPTMSYNNLSIQNGAEAVACFARAARAKSTLLAWPRLRVDLLKYCELDTLAMVRIHDQLLKLVNSPTILKGKGILPSQSRSASSYAVLDSS